MSRDTNQNLYAEQVITESPFYYDEHGRLRVRVLQEEMDEQEKKLRAEFNEKEKGVIRTADFYTDPETGESMTRREKAYRDFKKEKLAGGAKPDTTPAPEAPVKGGPAKPNPGIKPIAAAPPKETAEPVDVINAPNLRDTTDDTVLSTTPTEDKIKRGGNQSLPPLRPLPSDDSNTRTDDINVVQEPTLRDAPTARPAVGIGKIGIGRVSDMRARPELGIGRLRDKIGRGRVTDMRARLPGEGRITGINRRPIGGGVRRGGGINSNLRPTRPGSSGNMYAEETLNESPFYYDEYGRLRFGFINEQA